jgi:hypothetical protein
MAEVIEKMVEPEMALFFGYFRSGVYPDDVWQGKFWF